MIRDNVNAGLWEAIEKPYERGDYQDVIRNAFIHLTEAIQSISGLDSDGPSLASRAFSFNLKESRGPLIQVTSLYTETDRSIQEGIMYSLMGLYSLARNPFAHQKRETDKDSADAIILYLDYVLKHFIDVKTTNTAVEFCDRIVNDQWITANAETLGEWIKTLPRRERLTAVIKLFHQRQWGDNHKRIRLTIELLVSDLSEPEQNDFARAVSDSLESAQHPSEATLMVSITPSAILDLISTRSRMRLESMLLGEVKEALYFPEKDVTSSSNATWLSRLLPLKHSGNELRGIWARKLKSENEAEANFIAKWLLKHIDHLLILDVTGDNLGMVRYFSLNPINYPLARGNVYFAKQLVAAYRNLPSEWQQAIKDALDTDHYDTNDRDLVLTLLTHSLVDEGSIAEDDIPF